ncbi:MAG: PQQ-binding-like beta-propeller repeat protein [Planctomycetaceae bacterium]|nr:PQQ-binding-like beta-propeller repeat protein [Planctomycetales bacterium]MCB9937067.1 PQQ-binding-like beta-propeller repeat protein [Planctomycetaceae bacterium]
MCRKTLCRHTSSLILATVACSITVTSAQDKLRTWTDVTGQHKSRAAFVALEDDQVTLRREDGKTVKIPLDRLSAADQAFARRTARTALSNELPAEVARAGGDWPQWRGPNRDGISQETGLLDEWPADGPPTLWKASGLGGGYSSVAVAGNRIFTMGKFGGETRLVAVNAQNGEILWNTPVGSGDAPNCTPTVDNDLVFAVSHGGDLLCAESESGREVWRKNFTRDFGGKMMSMWGYSESPLVDGDRLIVTPGAQDAMMAALDKRTGKVLWQAAMPPNTGSAGQDGAGYSSIVISNGGGVKQYVQLVGRGVISVDARSGKMLWGYNRIANGTANVPTPIVTGDFVFCSSGYGDGGSALLRLTGARGQVNAQEVWYKSSKELQNHHGGMILIGDHVYMGHGHNNGFPVCFDLKSGRDAWRPGRGVGSGSAAVVCADGHLYFRYENGEMALIEATPSDYKLKGSFKIGINNGKSWAHPVVADGRLYLRDQHEMLCYDIRK